MPIAVLAVRLTGARGPVPPAAITPPSPLLSARMMKPTYLIVTTHASAPRKISESAPYTAKRGAPAPPAASALWRPWA